MALTAQARTVDALLQAGPHGPLKDFIEERRGKRSSYRRIALDLLSATDGAVDVTGETVRNWASDLGLLEKAAS